jgi:hypothetical protein
MRNWVSIFLVPALICALAGQGFAQESAPGAERKWYGGQTLLADVLSIGTFIAGIEGRSQPLAYVGAGAYLTAPAVIHGVHYHGGRAALSVLMRVGFPLVGGLVGFESADCHKSKYEDGEDAFCGFVPAMVGAGLGLVAASIVDASTAWDILPPAQPAPPPTTSSRHSPITFTTAGLVPTSNGPRLVLGGQF